MLDRKFVTQNIDLVRENCEKRGVQCDIEQVPELDTQRLGKSQEAQELNRQANEVSKQIPKAKGDAERKELIEKGRQLREQKDAAQNAHDEIDEKIKSLLATLPNMTHPDVPTGGEDGYKELSFGGT